MLSPEREQREGDMKRGFCRGEKSFTDHAVLYFLLKIYVSMPTWTLIWKNNDLESLCGEFV